MSNEKNGLTENEAITTMDILSLTKLQKDKLDEISEMLYEVSEALLLIRKASTDIEAVAVKNILMGYKVKACNPGDIKSKE